MTRATGQENEPRLNPGVRSAPATGRETVDAAEAQEVAQQKGWFSEYVYSRERPIIGTLWKWLTFKPVEGLLGGGVVGKVGRGAAIAAALYFGTPYLFKAFGAAEGASTGTGLNWFQRFGNAVKKLASPGVTGGRAGALESYGLTEGGA